MLSVPAPVRLAVPTAYVNFRRELGIQEFELGGGRWKKGNWPCGEDGVRDQATNSTNQARFRNL
jgi:hypothetical protein